MQRLLTNASARLPELPQPSINNLMKNKRIVSFENWEKSFVNKLGGPTSGPVAANVRARWNATPVNRKRKMYNRNMNMIRKYQAGQLTLARTPSQEKAIIKEIKQIYESHVNAATKKILRHPEGHKMIVNLEHEGFFKPNKWFGSIPLNSHARLGAALNHIDNKNIHFRRILSAAKAYHQKLGLGNGVANNAPVNLKRNFIKSVARNHLKFFRTMNSLKNASQKRAFMAMAPADRIRHLALRAGPLPRGVVPHWNI